MRELDNWNPMAEDYASPKFNSYNSDSEFDEFSLYIKGVPASLSQGAFVALMSENSRRVVRSKILEPKPGHDTTIGLVSFEAAKDAAEVIQRMNNKPPLNLAISYAHKKRPRKDYPSDESSNSHFHSAPVSRVTSSNYDRAPPPVSSSTDSPPFLGGKGRGNILNSIKKFPALRIVLDGEKRTSFAPPCSTETEVAAHSRHVELPKLVENPFLKCLACDNIGKFSCDGCKKPYCSSACQLKDWPKHKMSCNSNKRSRDSSYVSDSSGSDTEKKSPPAPLTTASFSAPKAQVVKIQDIQAYVLPKDKRIKVRVSHIENPSKFWVQPTSAFDLLSQMERDLSLSVKPTPSSHDRNLVYCINRHNSCKRVTISDVLGGERASVQFVDYGNTAIVPLGQLFLLPTAFKEISYQAVRCKLGDCTGEESEEWSEEDTLQFKTHAEDNRSYSAQVLKRAAAGTYLVNLMDDEGISLYSMISAWKNVNLSSMQVEESASSKNPSTIPSVCSNLKDGAEVRILGQEFSGDHFWGILHDGSRAENVIAEMDSLLQKLDTKDYSMCAEEGDVVAGFSVKFQQFYRCIVLKRMREEFLVHFIDYGNKEKTSKLAELTPELKTLCCYVVHCAKPESLSQDEFQNHFSEVQTVTVKKSEDGSTKLLFSHNNRWTFLSCHPWYHGMLQVEPKAVHSKQSIQKHSLSQNGACMVNTVTPAKRFPKNVSSQPRPAVSEVAPAKIITSELIPDLSVAAGTKYCVKVVVIVCASKLYIQLKENEPKLHTLCMQLNKYCSTVMSDKYSPVKNEIVCCKFKEDGNWYRGQVIGKKGNTYKVFFVDFGNEDVITCEEMKPLPENLSLHKFALCASLHDIDNEDLKEMLPELTEDYWDMKVVDKSSTPVQIMLYHKDRSLKDLIKKDVVLKKSSLQFQKLPKTTSRVMISHSGEDVVYVQREEDAEPIHQLLNKICSTVAEMPPAKKASVDDVYCALFSDGQWYRVSVDFVLPANQYLVTFLDYGNQDIVDLKNLKVLPEEFFRFPVFSIPVVPTNIKISQMQQQVWYPVDVVGEKSGAQLVTILNVQKKLVTLSSIKKTEFEEGVNEALISHVEEDIYYCLRSSDSEDLIAFSIKLKEYPGDKLDSEDVSVGSVVSAKSASDHEWYRGAISKILSGTSYRIHFIDFGNFEVVPLENIRKIPDNLVKYPLMAVPCKIINVEKATQYIAASKPLSLKPVGKSKDGIQSVEIVIPKSSSGLQVASLKKQLLPLNETSEISLCHIEGDVYYCQMVCDQDKLKSLESKLESAAAYESLDNLPDVGSVICAKFTDNVWYRGSVEETCKSSNSCKICFIDYGNTETISFENMKILPEELNEIPVLSIPVKFMNLEKLQALLEAGVTTFSVQAVELSEDGVQFVKIPEPKIKKAVITTIDAQLLSDLPTEVTVCHEEGGLYYVQKVSDEEGLTQMMAVLQNSLEAVQHCPKVGEILCAKYIDGAWYRGMVREECINNKVKVFFVDFGNTEDIGVKDLCYLPPSCATLPMFCIPIKLSDLNKCTTSLSVNSKYTIKRIKTFADNVQIVRVRPSANPVSVSSMKSSKLVEDLALVTFQSSQGDHYYLSKNLDADKIDEMNKLLRDFNGEDVFDAPVVDEIFVVKGADKNWHRGCIKATNKKPGFCSVFLLDQGTFEDIPLSDVCYLPEKLISYPLFSIKVLISSDSKIKASIGKECVVQVIKKFDTPTVQIVPHHMLDSLRKHHLPLQVQKKVEFCFKEGEVFFLQVEEDKQRLEEVVQKAQMCSLGIVHKARVGEVLAALSSLDGLWYRCCVEQATSLDQYKVNFIDFGNSEVVSKDKLRYIKDELSKYPPLCIAVKFANPPASIELERQYTVVAENLPESNEPQLVNLVTESAPQQHQASSAEASDSTAEKFVFDELNLVPFPDGDQDIIILSVQECNYVSCTPINQKNVTDLGTLNSKILEYCMSLSGVSSYEGDPPAANDMVLASFEGEWFRAAVINVEKDAYEVLFVDFGNTEKLPIGLLRRMRKEFMSLDMQAHLCELTGFQFKVADSAKIKEEIQTHFVNRPLRGVSKQSDEVINVQVNEIIKYLVEKNLATI